MFFDNECIYTREPKWISPTTLPQIIVYDEEEEIAK
jgi:hypothetical protein